MVGAIWGSTKEMACAYFGTVDMRKSLTLAEPPQAATSRECATKLAAGVLPTGLAFFVRVEPLQMRDFGPLAWRDKVLGRHVR